MAFCEKCGAQLDRGTAFCTKCGARTTAPATEATRFCARCGANLEPGKRFCGACGAPAEQPLAPAPPPKTAETFGSTAAVSPSPPPQKKSSLAKILVAVLGLFGLILAGIIGTCVYVGYRVKKKADQVEQAYKKATTEKTAGTGQGQAGAPPDISKILGALGQGAGQGQPGGSPDLTKILGAIGKGQPTASGKKPEIRPDAGCPSGEQTGFDEYVKAGASASIPLEPGLTLDSIYQPEANGRDIESIVTVNGIQASTIEVSGKALDGTGAPGTRSLCIGDFLTGREYETEWGQTPTGTVPEKMPGATMFSLSRAQFTALKAGQPAEMTYYNARRSPGGGYEIQFPLKGGLTRVEPADVSYSCIVNGATDNLPAIHAKGYFETPTGLTRFRLEVWVLDDAADPLVLNFRDASGKWHITYVKITFPVKAAVEQQLAQTGRAEIYGIYFDFNSATPRPESGPVLKEIAQALKDNPGWKLEIDGHTDNIGGDAYNQKLSQERAEGIRQSLITQYGIAADRLTSQGYGASRPKATNDTVEGRALNRRVELVRE
jgi:uncharacterized OB-fold protein